MCLTSVEVRRDGIEPELLAVSLHSTLLEPVIALGLHFRLASEVKLTRIWE